VGLDTSVFIYHFEGSLRFAEPAEHVLETIADGTLNGVTSIITAMELAVKPLQEQRPEVAAAYESLLYSFPNLVVVNINRRVARRSAELRAAHRLRPADALQVAACLEYGATALITNDRGLRRVSELQIILLEDFAST
jgi:predicted nucleic acid-binding protein